MPAGCIGGTEDILGDTCAYVSNGLNHKDAIKGDVLDALPSQVYDDAACAKVKGGYNFDNCSSGITFSIFKFCLANFHKTLGRIKI